MQHPCQHQDRSPLTRLFFPFWGPAGMMVAISLFSGTAGVQMGDWSFVGVDKLGHLLVFGLLGIAWLRSLRKAGLAEPLLIPAAVGLTTAFGLGDEFHQYLNPLRTFEWADLLADFSGALLATTLYQQVPLMKALLEIKIGRRSVLRSSSEDANSPR